MRIVCDLDDTLCRAGKDFGNAIPITDVIQRIRKLKNEGHVIIIYTGRGQLSCNGDIERIERKYRSIVSAWLKDNDVPCDELIFGKPLGDLYIDDKAMSVDGFLDSIPKRLGGNSGAEIMRIGNQVIKSGCGSAKQAEWYSAAAKLGINVPKVTSIVGDTIYMTYIPGIPGNQLNAIRMDDIYRIISLISFFSMQKGNYTFSSEKLAERVLSHLGSVGKTWLDYPFLFDFLKSHDMFYASQASFCHGDLSLSNTIFNEREIFLIDPIPNDNYSSYLLDYGKLLFSFDGGEMFLHEEEPDEIEEAFSKLCDLLSANGILKEVRAIEATYWLRLLKYTKDNSKKQLVLKKAKEIEGQL